MTLTVHLVDLALDTADLVLGETPKQHLDQLEAAGVGYEQRRGNLKSQYTLKGKCIFSHSAVSSPSERPKRFTHHPLADLFIPTPTRLLRDAAITRED